MVKMSQKWPHPYLTVITISNNNEVLIKMETPIVIEHVSAIVQWIRLLKPSFVHGFKFQLSKHKKVRLAQMLIKICDFLVIKQE